MTDLRQLLAFNMKFYRGNLGLSQSKLSERVDSAANYIAAIETGRKFPSVEMLEKIANALNIDTPMLFSMESLQISSMNNLHEEIVGDITQLISDYMTKKLKNLKTKRNLPNSCSSAFDVL
jgi:transcriptional regulator with XRE-family HTH domain